ncbi:Intradiol ring-cleavage dioxygenase core [Penicillium cf. griseofulvum]|uniref:Intradiol ring-cleavage dioxygenase core n=1 Tax=Penicillium cf. griseofulvum TaxID=2972120 RepID=A0A9W9M175_9EURO|nr:Intradiol ring-cleavage dioxygenase core [Penicillium cf. griseofulvum]KAJ5430305.1 Intradiol ring-cleavage dioxygenase core [Penicillium cf. griseofulvum]KAJ5435924.1 Intradiol ring-cleavage dioxygenase core [Penicillium cf. griseofulvum]
MATHRFNPTFTDNVINAMGPKTTPRMRKLMAGLIRHMHDYAREEELTVDEWMAGVQMLNWAGQMSDDKRNEGQLVCDVLGLESLVDEITFTLAGEAQDAPTATAILGPFFRADTPYRENGEDIVKTKPADAEMTFMHGRVMDFQTKQPLVGATVEVWQASTNGLYEQQDPEQVEFNLRGKFKTDEEGRYSFYCLRPTPYPVPNDGPAGKLLELMDRHPFRPAHIHIIATYDNYRPLTTQIFDRKDEYLDNDSVFAVKDSLVVDFVPRENDPQAAFELNYDVKLVKFEASTDGA